MRIYRLIPAEKDSSVNIYRVGSNAFPALAHNALTGYLYRSGFLLIPDRFYRDANVPFDPTIGNLYPESLALWG